MRATPNPLSCRLLAISVKIAIMPTMPYSPGVSRRARKMPITRLSNCMPPLLRTPQKRPLAVFCFRSRLSFSVFIVWPESCQSTRGRRHHRHVAQGCECRVSISPSRRRRRDRPPTPLPPAGHDSSRHHPHKPLAPT